jgi:hypothetical protein
MRAPKINFGTDRSGNRARVILTNKSFGKIARTARQIFVKVRYRTEKAFSCADNCLTIDGRAGEVPAFALETGHGNTRREASRESPGRGCARRGDPHDSKRKVWARTPRLCKRRTLFVCRALTLNTGCPLSTGRRGPAASSGKTQSVPKFNRMR